MNYSKEFEKYVTKKKVSAVCIYLNLSQFMATISPTIIEERQMNIASMDVFSRLMMDRIIFRITYQ